MLDIRKLRIIRPNNSNYSKCTTCQESRLIADTFLPFYGEINLMIMYSHNTRTIELQFSSILLLLFVRLA